MTAGLDCSVRRDLNRDPETGARLPNDREKVTDYQESKARHGIPCPRP